jgi:hypothetical protein
MRSIVGTVLDGAGVGDICYVSDDEWVSPLFFAASKGRRSNASRQGSKGARREIKREGQARSARASSCP